MIVLCEFNGYRVAMSHSPLFAGMPSVGLTDVAQMRLEVISFFLLLFVLSALAFRRVWNGLAKDFPRLPHMSFARSLGVMAVWGALFLFVLTMISGARELMTPGAWKKDGVTYKLAEEPKKEEMNSEEPTLTQRKNKLEGLYKELLVYSVRNDGRFPANRDSAGVPEDAWTTAHASRVRYQYFAGQTLNASPTALVAVEPDLFGDVRLGLFTDGKIRAVSTAEITAATPGTGKP